MSHKSAVCRNDFGQKTQDFIATNGNHLNFASRTKPQKQRVMKKDFFYAVMMVMAVLMTACSSDDDMMGADSTTRGSNQMGSEKTVLIYMAGRNNLSDTLKMDFNEIKIGSQHISDKQSLLVFVREYDGAVEPWLARIKNGEVTDSVSLSDMGIRSSDGENRASDPAVMEGVMQYAFSHYPATKGEYGLVLWGHGSGWLMQEEVNQPCTRAFGSDYGSYRYSHDERWINIPTLAQILKSMPHLKFIMADCCNFMCLENLYELRNVCDYIIGLPAEVPDQGAPYYDIVPDLFADGPFYTTIIDKYYKSVQGCLPLTAVKTSEMENLAQATRQAMLAVAEKIGNSYADMTGLIHYYYTDKRFCFYPEYNIFYDAGDFFLTHAPLNVYQQWRKALEQAIVDCRMATQWDTDKPWRLVYSDFTVTKEKFHGVSMFVPQNPSGGNYAIYNENIQQMAWWKETCAK